MSSYLVRFRNEPSTFRHDHKNSVMAVEWNKNGNWLLTGSRDHLIKLYDIRMMAEMQTFRGHKKEVPFGGVSSREIFRSRLLRGTQFMKIFSLAAAETAL